MDFVSYKFQLNIHEKLIFFLLFQIFTIIIINGCGRIEEIYSDIISECYYLDIEIKSESVRNDLKTIENCIRNVPPVFTAAGFFRLNQGLFSTFCSILVTYFIIIIQFNNANDDSTPAKFDLATNLSR